MTLPQLSSQSAVPAPVVSGSLAGLTPGKGVRSDLSAVAGNSSAAGNSFAHLLATAVSDAVSANAATIGDAAAQASGSSKKQTSPGGTNTSQGSSGHGSKNALAQLLAVRSNAAPVSPGGKPSIPQTGTETDASAVTAEGTATTAAAGKNDAAGTEIPAQTLNPAAVLSRTSVAQPARTLPFVIAHQMRPTGASQTKHAPVVGSNLKQTQTKAAASETKAQAEDAQQTVAEPANGSSSAGVQKTDPAGAEAAGITKAAVNAEAQTSAAVQMPVILLPDQSAAGANGTNKVQASQAGSDSEVTDPVTSSLSPAVDVVSENTTHLDQSSKSSAKSHVEHARSEPEHKSSPDPAARLLTLPNPVSTFNQVPALAAPPVSTGVQSESTANPRNSASGDASKSTASVALPAISTAKTNSIAPPVQDVSVPASGTATGSTQADHFAFALSASVGGQKQDSGNGDVASPVVSGTAKPVNQASAAVTSVTTVAGSHGTAIGTGAWQPGQIPAGVMHDRESRAVAPETATAPPDLHAESKLPASDTLRTLRVQFTGDNNQRVDVRLGNTGGELRVSVRSTDATLAQTMQDRMPELTSRLGEQHFHTEVWMPRETSGPGTGDARSGGSFSGGGDAYGQGQQGRRQNGQNQYKPEWIDDLEANPRRTQNLRRS